MYTASMTATVNGVAARVDPQSTTKYFIRIPSNIVTGTLTIAFSNLKNIGVLGAYAPVFSVDHMT